MIANKARFGALVGGRAPATPGPIVPIVLGSDERAIGGKLSFLALERVLNEFVDGEILVDLGAGKVD